MAKKKKAAASQELLPKELETLQSLLSEFNKSKISLAEATMSQRHALDEVMKNKVGFSKMEESLIKKYGKDVRVNVQTGELSFPEEQKA
jgi:hypothetical protein|tara:strand:+ start:6791 stop:7057 length:267 start_codon:yes stop_codon:yes gene_type:complete